MPMIGIVSCLILKAALFRARAVACIAGIFMRRYHGSDYIAPVFDDKTLNKLKHRRQF